MKPNVAKGTYYLLISTVVYTFSGYLMHIGLGRILGPSDYGVFVVVLYLMTLASLILTTGIPQAVAKFVSEKDEDADAVGASAMKVQFVLSLAIFLLYYLFAGLIASALNDESLKSYIQVSAFAIPISGIFSVYIFYLNGLRKYNEQAYVNILYSLARVTLPLALVLLGLSVFGAVIGQILAPLAAFFIFIRYPFWKTKSGFNALKIIRFAVPVVLFSAATSIFQSLDLFFVKSLLVDAAQTGYYSAVSTISKVPLLVMLALTGALYPAISSSSSGGHLERTGAYAREAFRYSLMFLLPVTFILSATSNGLVELLYSKIYLPAGEPLSLLVFGILFFALFTLFTTIMIGCSHPKAAMLISFFVLALDFIFNSLLVPKYGMMGAAAATTISSFACFLTAYFYTHRLLGSFMSLTSILRIVFSSAIVYLVATSVQFSGAIIMVWYVLLITVYLVLLFITREIRKEDIMLAKTLFRL